MSYVASGGCERPGRQLAPQRWIIALLSLRALLYLLIYKIGPRQWKVALEQGSCWPPQHCQHAPWQGLGFSYHRTAAALQQRLGRRGALRSARQAC